MSLLTLVRAYTILEGVSYLLLLCVAMPLKYLYQLPLAVRLAGGVHGVLFIAFVVGLYQAHREQAWTKRHSATLLLASLIPGSLFWLDRQLQRSWDHNRA